MLQVQLRYLHEMVVRVVLAVLAVTHQQVRVLVVQVQLVVLPAPVVTPMLVDLLATMRTLQTRSQQATLPALLFQERVVMVARVVQAVTAVLLVVQLPAVRRAVLVQPVLQERSM